MEPQSIWQRFRNMVRARYTAFRLRPSLSSVSRLTLPDGSRVNIALIGEWGEQLAVMWLRKNGRKVLYRNFKPPGGGEVDIVCRHGKTLTFVEVKTRTNDERGRPATAVTAAKEQLVLRGARAWLKMLDQTQGASIPRRCDIVEVLLQEGQTPRVTILEGAFKYREN